MSSPKPFTSLVELREWHVAQAAHCNGLATMHHAFAITLVAGTYKVADAYRERAKDYRKMAALLCNSAALLTKG